MRKIILTIVFKCLIIGINAQQDRYNIVDLHPASPTAFQFMKYTEMPVSEYTGIPNISIPIYEINVDGLKIPVQLTYHARGIAVSQEASWVGLGWDLQMGSLIQTINDRDDYGIDPVFGTNVKKLPDFFPSNGDGSPRILPLYNLDPVSGVSGSGWSSPYPIIQPSAQQGFAVATSYYVPVSGQFNVQQDGIFTQRWYDSEPDFFVANLPEGTVKFILDFNTPGRIAVLNKTGYLVKKTTGGFKIIAPTGNSYFFETESDIRNITNSTSMMGVTAPYAAGGDTVSKVFFLSKIITKNKKQISFQYSSTSPYSGYPTRSQKMQALTNASVYNNSPAPTGGGNYSFNMFDGRQSPPWMGSGTYNTDSYNIEQNFYLQSIIFPTGRVDFKISGRSDINGGQKLDSIQLINSNGTMLKAWKLDYSYFDTAGVVGNGYGDESGGTLSSNPLSALRLKLLDLKEIAPGGSVFNFSYNSTKLPKKNSYAQDYWGFYNGSLSNTSFVPNPATLNLSGLGNNGNNKDANLTYTQACILKGIQYPTGGMVSFEFELNQFGNDQMLGLTPANSTIQGNGLRIHAVNHLNIDSSLATRTVYTYGTGRQINFIPIVQQIPSFSLLTSFGASIQTTFYTLTQLSVNGVFGTNPFGSVNGVGYDTVTKQNVDAYNNALGRTMTTFYNTVDLHNPSIYSRTLSCNIPTVRSMTTPENGSVMAIATFDNQNQLLKKVQNNYTLSASPIYYGARILPYGNLYYSYTISGTTSLQSMPQSLIGYFPIYDVQTMEADTYDTTYFSNGKLGIHTSYTYDLYNQLSAVNKERSDGGTDNTQFYYPYNPQVSSPILSTMIDSNRISDIVTLQRLTNLSVLKYKYDKDFLIVGDKIMEKKVVIQDNPIPYGNLNVPDSITYDLYDAANGNLLQYTQKGLLNSFIWDYGGNYTVAEVKNAGSASIAYTSFESDGLGGIYLDNGNVGITTTDGVTGNNSYQINNGLARFNLDPSKTYVVSLWAKSGTPSYNGFNGATQVVATSNVWTTGKTVNGWTYLEKVMTGVTTINVGGGGGLVDEVRFYPSNAQMTTYAYTPLVGLTSQCDMNNHITYYEYDGMCRLKVIRDQDRNIIKTLEYHYQGQP